MGIERRHKQKTAFKGRFKIERHRRVYI